MSTTPVVDEAGLKAAAFAEFVAWKAANPTKDWVKVFCELAKKTAALITEAKNAEADRIIETTASDSPSPEKRIRR